jgi:hypothetical protein
MPVAAARVSRLAPALARRLRIRIVFFSSSIRSTETNAARDDFVPVFRV